MSNDWFSVGHQTLEDVKSGCTVIVFDDHVPAVVDVRGGAPGTRETTLLDPARRGVVDAILLSGGSAFGLRAADGVMQYLVEHDRGHPTAAGLVPLVPGAIIYDLAIGSPYKPTPEDGYSAAAAAERGQLTGGRIGAGTGATVAKLGGAPQPGGVATATVDVGGISVSALIVVNAIGDIVDPASGVALRESLDEEGNRVPGRQRGLTRHSFGRVGESTTIGCILVSAPMNYYGLSRCAIAAHDALARCVVPAHTIFDGDTFFAAAPGAAPIEQGDLFALSCGVEIAVEKAITNLFREASEHGD